MLVPPVVGEAAGAVVHVRKTQAQGREHLEVGRVHIEASIAGQVVLLAQFCARRQRYILHHFEVDLAQLTDRVVAALGSQLQRRSGHGVEKARQAIRGLGDLSLVRFQLPLQVQQPFLVSERHERILQPQLRETFRLLHCRFDFPGDLGNLGQALSTKQALPEGQPHVVDDAVRSAPLALFRDHEVVAFLLCPHVAHAKIQHAPRKLGAESAPDLVAGNLVGRVARRIAPGVPGVPHETGKLLQVRQVYGTALDDRIEAGRAYVEVVRQRMGHGLAK